MTSPNNPDHQGRSVLITGGSRGIGLAAARRLADAGHRVAVTYRSSAAPEGLLGVACDVADTASLTAAVAEVSEAQGPVEILVSAAGITRDGLLMRMSESDWDSVIDTNLRGAWAAAKAVIPAMARGRFGRLVFLSSVSGMLGAPGQTNYAASKAGLIGLARSIAREYARRGITANVVAPGLVDTDMTAALTDAQRDGILANTPLGRLATANEVAAAIAYLASDEAGYVTGAVLPVDGGLGMGH